jgi:membrane peptidoglycan carboxypeptidase
MILYNITKKDVTPKRYETHIIDKFGDVTRVLARGESRRVYVKYSQIPDNLIKAIVAVEDKRYYRHKGIDLIGVLRAIVHTVGSNGRRIQGGSTITQQLIKNTIFVNWIKERTFFDKLVRKVNEFFLAPRIEKRIGKRQILECYLNTIYFGEGCYGVQTASRTYFGKDVWNLSLGECAMLAGIPKNPSRFDPFLHAQKCISRRNLVLDIMYSQQLISKEEYENEKLEDLTEFIEVRKKKHKNLIRPYSWFEDALISELISEMKKKGLLLDAAWKILFEGGLRIYSTEDVFLQKYAQKLCCDEIIIPDLKDPNGPQVAVIMLDLERGEILVSVGGKGKKTAGLLFDRAGAAKRTSGTQSMVRAFERLDYTPKGDGTNILELCIAYAVHENKGHFPKAHYFDKVLEKDGRIILKNGLADSSKPGEVRLYSNPLPKMWELTLDTDVWVIGRTGNTVLGVWGGYDDNRRLPLKKEYYTYPKTIWKKIADQNELRTEYVDEQRNSFE